MLTGCSSSVKTTHDDFEGFTINEMALNNLSGGVPFVGAAIGLQAQRFESKEGVVDYNVIVRYASESWLYIENGESLILLVDGESLNLSGEGSLSHREVQNIGKVFVVEHAWYKISPENLKKIASASEVRIKLIGTNHFEKRHFSEKNLKKFKEFVEEYVK